MSPATRSGTKAAMVPDNGADKGHHRSQWNTHGSCASAQGGRLRQQKAEPGKKKSNDNQRVRFAFPRGSVCRIAAVTSGFRLANEPDSRLSQPSFTTRCPLTCHNGGRRFFFSSHKIRGGQQPRAASPHAPAKAPRPRSQDRRPPALFTTASPRANKTKARARAYREERWRATRKKKKKKGKH